MIEQKQSLFKGWPYIAMRPPPRLSELRAQARAEAKRKSDEKKNRSFPKSKKKTSVSA